MIKVNFNVFLSLKKQNGGLAQNLQGGVFSKNFRPGGGYTKNTPYPLFPLPG